MLPALKVAGVRDHDPVVQVVGQPERDHVEHHADDDLVHQEHDREDGEYRPDQAAGQRPAEQPEPDAAGGACHGRRDERPGEQLALDRDVDDAGALAQAAGQGAENQRDGRGQRPLQQVDDLQRADRVAGVRPGQQREQEAEQCDRDGDPLASAGRGLRRPAGCPGRSRPPRAGRPSAPPGTWIPGSFGVAPGSDSAKMASPRWAKMPKTKMSIRPSRMNVPAARYLRFTETGARTGVSQRGGHPDHPFDATA